MNEPAALEDNSSDRVHRPSGKFGTIGLVLGIFGIVIPCLGLGALLVSWIGFRSRRVVCARIGYALGWVGCVVWAYILFLLLMFSSMMSGGFMMANSILDPVEGAVLSIRVYQVEHDGSLPDDETGTRILTGAVKPLIASELSWLGDTKKNLGPPQDWFNLVYTRQKQDAWRAQMIYSKAFEAAITPNKDKDTPPPPGKGSGDTYEFHASGAVIRASAGY